MIRDAIVGQQRGDPVDEAGEVRDVAEHVDGDDHVRSLPVRPKVCGNVIVEEFRMSVGMPRASATAATFSAGSMPSTGTPRRRKCWSR